MSKAKVSRTIAASRDRVWGFLTDLEGWPGWAPLSARNRIISNQIVSRDGTRVVCDRVDQVGVAKSSHKSTYTIERDGKIIEEMSGGLRGTSSILLQEVSGGTQVTIDDTVEPTGFFARLALALMGGDGVISSFWNDILGQLAAVAESPCSLDKPMYCPSRTLDSYFERPSKGIDHLVNRGGRTIDVGTLTVFSDEYWKGIYPPDSVAPAWVFQNGFNKKFTQKDGQVTGLTMTFDNSINGNNKPVLVDSADPGKGIILEYTDPQYSMFYDLLKVVSDEIVVGKAFTGKYPSGSLLLNFTMARRYSFDFMTPEDHKDLFEKYGKAPDVTKIAGEWEGRMVSNASLTPPLFRFWYSVDAAGMVSCKWNFMNILKGNSKVEMTKDQMLMFDFTNFHDEIRMVRDDAMVGRYAPQAQKILDILGDRDLGLLHFLKGDKGTRPAILYYIRKVSNTVQ